MVSSQVLDAVLPLAIDGLVQLFDNPAAFGLGPREMAVYIANEDSQALRPISELARTHVAGWRSLQHDPCVTQMYLRAAHRVAIAVVFAKGEGPGQPPNRLRKVRIADVRQNGARRNRTVLNHDASLLKALQVLHATS